MDKLLVLLGVLALAGCGAKVEVEGLRDIKIIHEVSVANLEPYIAAYCGLANETAEDIAACVNIEIGKLVTKL